ncbi:MAG TPA: DUF3619 family protein [Burkholderiales bacterium]|nr:DUF3619 family protein [Burkholderiales bacterium]
MTEAEIGKQVRQALEEGVAVDARVAGRLREARQRALARQRTAPVLGLAWADNVLGRLDGWGGFSLRVLLPLLLLAAGVAGIYAWERQQRVSETADIDAALLSGELPIDAYLDRGFQNWLKKHAAEP